MPSTQVRSPFLFSSIHWALVLASAALLVQGWYIRYLPVEAATRGAQLDTHVSFGLSVAIVTAIQVLLLLFVRPLSYYREFPAWRKWLIYPLYLLFYLSLILVSISGYLQAAFAEVPLRFWGIALPVWEAKDGSVAEFFRTLHGLAALALVGAIVLNVALPIVGGVQPSRAGAPPASEPEARELAIAESEDLSTVKFARNFAGSLRLFGWIEFWIQLVLALATGVLLEFASSGHAFSPGTTGFSDGIYWAGYGFLLLCLATLLAFYYTRVARKVVSRPRFYLDHAKRLALWFLWAGLLTGLSGIFVSFVGVGLSISLLVVKTISQPPGIAITNPQNIIRALDVFVLIVNIVLLMAHFIGTAVALWLGVHVSRTRMQYIAGRKYPG